MQGPEILLVHESVGLCFFGNHEHRRSMLGLKAIEHYCRSKV